MKNVIWSFMVKRKVFTAKDIVKDLEATKYKYLGKSFLRNKVKDFIKQQLYKATITAVSEGIFALKDYAKDWEKYIEKRKCAVCDKDFVPFEEKQLFCSKECKKEYYKLYHQTKRHRGKTSRKFQNWQKWEEEKLIEAFKPDYRFNRQKASQLSKELGRSEEAIKERLKIIRKRLKGAGL
ncbi:hypothetical protein SAMN06265182_1237 [Persephonella hydrogeniphila]|uniref:Uncharacterized protein n=1 Tax=Persephonella hydrogeniphila TaxID=198703 RepID=A0A285NK50_9AQUI|nr:hypothetical protein [Persephonella hydrogeniphila]SNZ08256.1 hypothetical protein SAMN06265182_1237 [Persephonella hydrogeniphila]